MYFKNYFYLKIGQWRGLYGSAEGGVDSAEVTGIQNLLPVQYFSLSDKCSAADMQVWRSTFSQNVDARLA